MKKIVEIKNLSKSFGTQPVLKNLFLDIYEGEFLVLTGASGCGKSTLMNIIGLLDTADSGEIILFNNTCPKPFSRPAVKLLRNNIGYLFQNFALVDDQSLTYNLDIALENVSKLDRKKRIDWALSEVGLSGYGDKVVFQCSGGEQQRIAIARLLLKSCELVLCDEPTGSLDKENRQVVLAHLKKLQEMGKTIVVVSHDPEVAEVADRVVVMSAQS